MPTALLSLLSSLGTLGGCQSDRQVSMMQLPTLAPARHSHMSAQRSCSGSCSAWLCIGAVIPVAGGHVLFFCFVMFLSCMLSHVHWCTREREFHSSIQPALAYEDASWLESSAKLRMAVGQWQTAFWSLCHTKHCMVPSASWYDEQNWRRTWDQSALSPDICRSPVLLEVCRSSAHLHADPVYVRGQMMRIHDPELDSSCTQPCATMMLRKPCGKDLPGPSGFPWHACGIAPDATCLQR